MKIGVISEGHADRAVITNILRSFTGIDESDVLAIRPIYNYDETDKAVINPQTFSTWSIVMKECQERTLIDNFLSIEGQDFIVIHIDTAEAQEYGVARPNKGQDDYCEMLRDAVIKQINTWLKDDISASILYAVAIEEIDSWILTLFEKRDSTKTIGAKERLRWVLKKKDINSTSDYDNYKKLSKPLSKSKSIAKGNFLIYNCSLKAFYEEVQKKVVPRIE